MNANAMTLERLQSALSMELTAVHQYLLHAHVVEDWGLDKLAAKMREEMQEELGHADAYLRRIMFLNGDPKMMPAKTPARAQALTDLFEADLADEREAIKFYTEAAELAGKNGDIGTRKLFEGTVLDNFDGTRALRGLVGASCEQGTGAFASMLWDDGLDGGSLGKKLENTHAEKLVRALDKRPKKKTKKKK